MAPDSRFVFRVADWEVRRITTKEALPFVREHHYAKGASLTAVFVFGLFLRGVPSLLWGVAWFLPPTKPAAQSVDPEKWKDVLSLSRLCVAPSVPKNGASFLLMGSVRQIKRHGRWAALVTYADESQGHTGHVYRACGWEYVGRMKGSPRWVDPRTGRQVAVLSTRSRTKQQMVDLGYVDTGVFAKHKYVLRIKQ